MKHLTDGATIFFMEKAWLNEIERSAVCRVFFPSQPYDRYIYCLHYISLTHDYMSKFVLDHQPNLMFIHFDSIDMAGHAFSWGSPEYYDAAKVGRAQWS